MSRTSAIERVVLGLAAAVALAVWVPWPYGARGEAERPDIRFAGRNDPAANISHLSARPLLDPARTSVSAATAPAKPAAPIDVGERFVLRGLAQVGQIDVAVFEDRTSGKFVRLQRGQEIAGWYLAEVREVAAILKNGANGERRMPLVVKGR